MRVCLGQRELEHRDPFPTSTGDGNLNRLAHHHRTQLIEHPTVVDVFSVKPQRHMRLVGQRCIHPDVEVTAEPLQVEVALGVGRHDGARVGIPLLGDHMHPPTVGEHKRALTQHRDRPGEDKLGLHTRCTRQQVPRPELVIERYRVSQRNLDRHHGFTHRLPR